MAKMHGRFADKPTDRSIDPDRDTVNTTPGFKLTERGPGIERLESRPARTPERPELKALAQARAASRVAQKEVRKAAAAVLDAARKALPDLDQLRRENAIPAKIERTVVTLPDQSSPEDVAAYRAWKRERNIKDALASQDPMAEKTTNASLHTVKTPGGVAKYHAEKQKAALELAKGLKGADRKFALRLAKDSAKAKRAAGGGGKGQKRVPSGQTTGGRWTK
jgi:hypothetical protein